VKLLGQKPRGLAAFGIGEINGADGGDSYEHQDGGEQGKYDQRSPPVY